MLTQSNLISINIISVRDHRHAATAPAELGEQGRDAYMCVYVIIYIYIYDVCIYIYIQ